MAELSELETRLSALAAEIDWPPSPVIAAIPRGFVAQRPWYTSRWALAAAVAIVAAAALMAYPPSRTAIADWVNVHLSLKRTTVLPTLSPLPPGPLGKRLGLGSATTMSAARGSVKWTILVPASLGAPDEVYSQSAFGPPQGEITLVYAARTDIPVSGLTGVSVLITEARGSVDATFFGKIVGSGTTVEPITVGGHDGYWFSGAPHVFFFTDANGDVWNETMRLATNTLIIDNGGTVIRIEGDLTKQQALAIASSLG